MIRDWPILRDFALGLNLPKVAIYHPHGQESLQAFGRLWCQWSPYADAAVFRWRENAPKRFLKAYDA